MKRVTRRVRAWTDRILSAFAWFEWLILAYGLVAVVVVGYALGSVLFPQWFPTP